MTSVPGQKPPWGARPGSAMTSATSSLASLHRDESAALPGVVRSSLSPAVGGMGVWGLGKGGKLGRFSGWYGYVMGYCTTTGYGLLLMLTVIDASWCFFFKYLLVVDAVTLSWRHMISSCAAHWFWASSLGTGMARLVPWWSPVVAPPLQGKFWTHFEFFFFEHCSPI